MSPTKKATKTQTQKRKYAGTVIQETNILGNPIKDTSGENILCISGTDDRWGASLGLRKPLPQCGILSGGKKKRSKSNKKHTRKTKKNNA